MKRKDKCAREKLWENQAMRKDGDKDDSGSPGLTSYPWKKPPYTFLLAFGVTSP